MSPRPGFERLNTQTFDVVIIGGGINGAAIARDAALRGMAVCLLERGDFASGTSSSSSKLVHGGVRYLAHGDFRLVHEACRERRLLLTLAPHLVHPLRFLVPVYQSDEWGLLSVRAGMMLYDVVAAFRNVHPHRMLNAARTLGLQSRLEPRGLTGAALYYDCQMDDARLCIENVLSAREAGAVCLNYTPVRGLVKSGGRAVGVEVEDLETATRTTIRAHVVLNTTGPWTDTICDLDEGRHKPKVRPTKGVHLIVRPFIEDHAVVISSERDGRMFFVLPWHEYTMIGTTDTDHDSPPRLVYATGADVEYLLTETRNVFPDVSLEPADVIATFAGLRPLMNQQGVPESDVSREHVLFESDSGVISMVGGKYTTYRAQAQQATDLLERRLYPRTFRPCLTRVLPTYGGNVGDFAWYLHEQVPLAARHMDLEPHAIAHLIAQYGSRYRDVLRVIARDPEYRLPLSDAGPYLRGEVVYHAEVEAARTVGDVLRRRTRLQLSVGNGLDCADRVAQLLGAAHGWDADQRALEVRLYAAEVARTQDWRRGHPDTAGAQEPVPRPAAPVSSP